MNITSKKETRLIISELQNLVAEVNDAESKEMIKRRIASLESKMEGAPEDFFEYILKSHEVICEVKNMGRKEAYGQDPVMYYTLAICAESGEMANKLVRNLRDGYDQNKITKAIVSELPDIFIYSCILAHVMDLDIFDLINQKTEVVINRAKDGYYGGELKRGS